MSARTRLLAFLSILVVVIVVASVYTVREARRYQAQTAVEPDEPKADLAAISAEPHLVFRHTGIDNSYGLVAMVALDDPDGGRAFTDVPCDRVAAGTTGASCLVTERGVTTAYETVLLDPDWQVSESRPLPGLPSRTRLSPDGSLVATTSFVTGHSYMQVGFSTATDIAEADGERDFGNLERFTFRRDGETIKPVDRNFWGVTFVDDETFYATVETGGRTHMVEGSISERTVTIVADDVECPSISPDGTRVAFKSDHDPGAGKEWGLAVLDLATGERTELDRAPRGVDDQVAWLDDDTLMYGLPRADEPGVTDVWSLDTSADAEPAVLVPEAWSPTIVAGVGQ